jgi:hypothetical protein
MVAFVAVCVAAVVVCKPSLPAAEDKKADELARFMRKKLDASSHILEGLTAKDAGLIKKGAASLLQMSKAELWNVLTDADYREFNSEFRSSLRKLELAADEANFDNALLQWFDGVKGCVECHKFVREQRVHLKN